MFLTPNQGSHPKIHPHPLQHFHKPPRQTPLSTSRFALTNTQLSNKVNSNNTQNTQGSHNHIHTLANKTKSRFANRIHAQSTHPHIYQGSPSHKLPQTSKTIPTLHQGSHITLKSRFGTQTIKVRDSNYQGSHITLKSTFKTQTIKVRDSNYQGSHSIQNQHHQQLKYTLPNSF